MVRRDAQWSPVTWKLLADDVRSVGSYLIGQGLEAGDRVAIFAPNRVEWLIAAYAIQAAGGVMVPIYPSSTADQAGYVIQHSDARFLFVDTDVLLARVFDGWDACQRIERIITLDDALLPSRVATQVDNPPSVGAVEQRIVSWSTATRTPVQSLGEVRPDQGAIMLYTSGTSGRPKGVPLTHANLSCNTQGWLRACAGRLEEDAVELLWLPMSHIFGYAESCIGNLLGWTSYLSDPEHALEDLQAIRPQVFWSVPAYWEKLARDDRSLAEATGGRLQFCLSGGAGLKMAVKERFADDGILIIEGYGLTECSPTLTINRPDDYRFDTVGKPLDNVEIRLADDGEILARGDNIFSGYHKDAKATAATFEDGWFKTGDIGRWTDDGFLQIVDRKKDILVTSGGKNIAPANIEVRFKDDPALEHVVVYGDNKKYLVAGVWPAPGATREAIDRAIERVNGEVARYETIKKIVIFDAPLTVEGGFLTPTLKLRRKHVYAAFGETLESLYE